MEEAEGPVKGPTPRRQKKYVSKCLRLKSYLRSPGDGRAQGHIPADLLPGSLALTHRRCGQPTCHCATDKKGHPVWSLTFMAGGKKHVERIPNEWVEEVQRLVEAGREFKEAVAEVFAANAQLLALWRRQKGL